MEYVKKNLILHLEFTGEMSDGDFLQLKGWLWHIGANYMNMEIRSLEETRVFLSSTGLNTSRITSELQKELSKHEIEVLMDELNLLLDKVWEQLRTLAEDKHPSASRIRDVSKMLTGKWMIFASEKVYSKLFTEIVEVLKLDGLDYLSKAPSPLQGNRTVLIFYVPSFLATKLVIGTLSAIENVLERQKISTPAFFKPDVFTREGIYSRESKYHPYIYRKVLK
jgi:hypothetical protein